MKAVAVGLALCAVMMAASVSMGASSESCKTCSQVATEFISTFPKRITEAEWMQKHCTMSSIEMREFCKSYFSKFGKHIASGIQTSNASHLCAGISTCPVSLTKCSVCQFYMVAYGDYLTSSNGKKDYRWLLKHVCKFYPAELRSNCTSASKHNDATIDWLTDNWMALLSKSLWICTLLSLCQSA